LNQSTRLVRRTLSDKLNQTGMTGGVIIPEKRLLFGSLAALFT